MADTATIGRAVNDLTARFAAAGLDTPRLDARLLVGHVLGLEPSMLFTRPDAALSPRDTDTVEAVAARRLAHEPVSRIMGHRAFWGLDFALSAATLDPRPDTETLVAAVLDLKPRFAGKPVRILDLGTGTGCIVLAILSAWPEAVGVGIDLSPDAVATATANAARLGLEKRTTFQVGNWCDGLRESFDLIVSNPPYIADDELPALAPEVTRFDPMLALRGGADGLAAYRRLVPDARRVLADGGGLFLETGAGQAAAVGAILAAAAFRLEAQHKDLAGFTRCLQAVTA